MRAIAGELGKLLRRTCVPRELNRNHEGEVDCKVTETLPVEGEMTRCDPIPGRERAKNPDTGELRTGPDGGAVCEVRQLVAPKRNGTRRAPQNDAAGWYYDDFSQRAQECGEGQQIAFTSGAEPPDGAQFRLECLQPVEQVAGEDVALGAPCNPNAEQDPCRDPDVMGGALRCEPNTRTCRLPCDTDATCLEHNLGGFRCDARPESAFRWPACVNPTCGR
jgi:hypothetical protein